MSLITYRLRNGAEVLGKLYKGRVVHAPASPKPHRLALALQPHPVYLGA